MSDLHIFVNLKVLFLNTIIRGLMVKGKHLENSSSCNEDLKCRSVTVEKTLAVADVSL